MKIAPRLVFGAALVLGLAGCSSPAPPKKPAPQPSATNSTPAQPLTSAPESTASAPVSSAVPSASVAPIASGSSSATTAPPSQRVVVCMDCYGETIIQYAHFDHRQVKILKASLPLLEVVSEMLQKYPEIHVEIRGHTDVSEARPGGGKLGLARAEAVKKWLVEHGIDSKRLVAKDYGATQPLVVPHSERDRAMNRRVEFKKVEP